MTSKVKLSTYSFIITCLIIGILSVGGFFLIINGEKYSYLSIIILVFVLISGMIYGPVSMSTNEQEVTVKSLARRQRFPISQIEKVELFQPTMGAIRLLGSGGYMGYWGIFREGDIGKYVAYYGKASDCFLIRMKNGDKYVLGCENPDKMVEFINSKIK